MPNLFRRTRTSEDQYTRLWDAVREGVHTLGRSDLRYRAATRRASAAEQALLSEGVPEHKLRQEFGAAVAAAAGWL